MRLNHFYNLIFDTIDSSETTEMEIAYKLGIERANISNWRAEKRIPEKHFKQISDILSLPKTKVLMALKKDIEERFK